MLTTQIDDQVESPGPVTPGLGLLPASVTFDLEKTLGRPRGSWQGHDVTAYEIHHGSVDRHGGEAFLDGIREGTTWGTIWHGAFENDGFRRAWLTEVAASVGSSWAPRPNALGFADRRRQMLDDLADALEAHVDLPALLAAARG